MSVYQSLANRIFLTHIEEILQQHIGLVLGYPINPFSESLVHIHGLPTGHSYKNISTLIHFGDDGLYARLVRTTG